MTEFARGERVLAVEAVAGLQVGQVYVVAGTGSSGVGLGDAEPVVMLDEGALVVPARALRPLWG